ncbi:MFS transporter [Opitutaceae bacterium EW11]|nr:MFS transporter [Opitutaceae bacterium EW11]
MFLSPRDQRLLFATRIVRLFGCGFSAVVLFLHLSALGFSEAEIGLLLSFTFLGDAAISLWLSTSADRWGRRHVLIAGAWLMILGGVTMATTGNFLLLIIGATIGVISPTGNEVGPFLAVEQASLTHIIPDRERTRIFAWYHVAGFTATAVGALIGGVAARELQRHGLTSVGAYRVLFWAYAACGASLAVLSARLSAAVEVNPPGEPVSGRHTLAARPEGGSPGKGTAGKPSSFFGLHSSGGLVARLSGLFAVDAFAGGFVVQSVVAYWFHLKFGVSEAALGAIFFGTNLLSGLSALAAAPLAKRIGLVNTMVWTHLPSNLLLIAVPFMPSLATAVAVLLVRHLISQMDVPTRQSYVNAVVPPGERSAANGITGTARQIGVSIAPTIAGRLLGFAGAAGWPFWIAGGLKIAYDLALWRSFRAVKPPEER